MPYSAGRAWTTRGIAPQEQFIAWQQIIDQTYLPVMIEHGRPSAAGFHSALRARPVGDVIVSRLHSDPQAVHRCAKLVDAAPGEVYFLNLPFRGGGVAMQDGRMATPTPGDFVLIDGARPFRLSFPDEFDQIALVIPHYLIDPLLARPRESTCRTVSGRSAAGRVASAAVRALARVTAPMDARTTCVMTEHVIGLIALAVTETLPTTTNSPRIAHLQAALDEIDRSLSDPDLHPALVATRTCISVSYLTKLFALHGTSFGRVVQARRLDRAYALLSPRLEAPSGSAGSVGSVGSVGRVASACGFTDAAHFSRIFRARFAITPSQRLAGQVAQHTQHAAEPGRSPHGPAPLPAVNA